MFLPDIDSPLSLQEILQLNLEQNPTFASYVYPDHGTENLTEISMLEFVRASYRAGNAVFKNGAKPGDVVGIIANLDNIVYMALIAGLMNLGLVPFPISPRNSPRGIIDILRQSSAHRLLTTNATLAELLHSIQAELQSDTPFALQIEEAPSLREVFPYLGRESENEPNVVPCHSFFPKDTDSVMYIHSSGSTGLPKAIRLSHLNFLSYLSVFCMDDLRTHGRYAAAGVPPFHLMGVYNQLFLMLYGRVTISIFHPTVTKPDALPVVMSPDNVFENARLTQATSMLTVPTFLHIWSHSEAAVKQLAKYSLVFYGGGPLPPSTGDYLASRGVNIASGYGCTEAGLLIKAAISHEDWSYTQFSDKCTIRWVPQGDGTFEAQFLTTDRHRPAIENLKDVRGYATSDLFVPHPTDPKKWKIVGRIDDVVVHSSGEKTVPAPMEAIITSTNIIQGAIIFGHRRDQPGLLVEPSSSHQVDTNDSAQVAAFRNLIW